jgi:hypothetical protein
MIRISRQKAFIAAVVLLTVVFMLIGASTVHVGKREIAVTLLCLVLALALMLGYIRFRPQVGRKSRIPLITGMIFVAGALYGLVQSVEGGWQWTDLVSLIIPAALGSYFTWFGLRKTSNGSGPGRNVVHD